MGDKLEGSADQSMQGLPGDEPERNAEPPSREAVLLEVRRRKEATGTRVSASEILAARDADRT